MDDLIIYYINLDKDIERNSNMKNMLDKLNIKYERIQGINGSDINIKKKYKILYNTPCLMSRGQYGCYLSHIKCYEKFIKSNYKYLIILEDDTILNDNFKNSITNLFDNYNKLLKEKIDFIYLSRSNIIKEQYKVNIKYFNDDFIYSPEIFGYGFHSYFLTKNGSKKLLNIINDAKIHYDKHDLFAPIDLLEAWYYFGKTNKKNKIILYIYALKKELSYAGTMGSNTDNIT